jgi:hypothetical membrane protein
MFEKIAAWCGILATIIFVLAIIVFSILTPSYSNLTNAISELGASGAPYALAVNIFGFILVGILIVVYAWGLHLGLRNKPGAIILPLLAGISGIGVIGWGVFPAESGFRPSTQTTLHFLMVFVNYLPYILAAFIFSIKLKADPYWRHLVLFSIVMGILAIASYFLPRSIPAGVSQRIGLGTYFLWVLVMAFSLLKRPLRSKQ